MPKQVPFLQRSPLLNRWTIVTKYRVTKKTTTDGKPIIEAKEKFDVHDAVEKIIAEEVGLRTQED